MRLQGWVGDATERIEAVREEANGVKTPDSEYHRFQLAGGRGWRCLMQTRRETEAQNIEVEGAGVKCGNETLRWKGTE